MQQMVLVAAFNDFHLIYDSFHCSSSTHTKLPMYDNAHCGEWPESLLCTLSLSRIPRDSETLRDTSVSRHIRFAESELRKK